MNRKQREGVAICHQLVWPIDPLVQEEPFSLLTLIGFKELVIAEAWCNIVRNI